MGIYYQNIEWIIFGVICLIELCIPLQDSLPDYHPNTMCHKLKLAKIHL